MTTEAGGFTLNGEAVSSGATHEAANGNYTLTLAGGSWAAAFAPNMMDVPPGNSGDSVTIVQMETGGYSLDGEAITAHTTAVASNGARYGVALGADGPMVVYLPTEETFMLGMEGGPITLTLDENQMTYSRDGEACMSGTEVMSNGRSYTVTMGADGWMAEFNKPMQTVTLGGSDYTITLIQDEQMAWWIGGPDNPIADGGTYSMGANTCTLMQGDDGMWTAMFTPKMMDVMLGTSGSVAVATQLESGGYMVNGMPVADGAYATAANGAMYKVTAGEDGMPMAVYSADSTPVMLGDLGGTITIYLQEDRMTYLDEDGMEIMSGDKRMSGQHTYTVTMNEDGTWTGTYDHYMVTVELGTSGLMVTLIRDEAGGWWTDPQTAFESGDDYTAENGNAYTLTLVDGTWSSAYNPATMQIAGTGLVASALEAGDGYEVVGSDGTLDAEGAGTITTAAGAMYKVSMDDDGMLTGLRFDPKIENNTRYRTAGISAYVAYGDGNSNLVIAGEKKIPLGDVLEGSYSKPGAASDGAPGEFVQEVTKALMALRTEAEIYAVRQAEAPGEDRSDFDVQLTRIATDAQAEIDKIFDDTENVLAGLPTLPDDAEDAEYIRATDTVAR